MRHTITSPRTFSILASSAFYKTGLKKIKTWLFKRECFVFLVIGAAWFLITSDKTSGKKKNLLALLCWGSRWSLQINTKWLYFVWSRSIIYPMIKHFYLYRCTFFHWHGHCPHIHVAQRCTLNRSMRMRMIKTIYYYGLHSYQIWTEL